VAGGLMIWGSHKLRKQDVDQIEEYSGQPVDEMTDEEMEQAISDLNIQPEELSAEDEAYYAEEEAQEPTEGDYLDELERLGHLRDQGYISDEEFQMKKRQLLGL
jgi:hypothetical protein